MGLSAFRPVKPSLAIEPDCRSQDIDTKRPVEMCWAAFRVQPFEDWSLHSRIAASAGSQIRWRSHGSEPVPEPQHGHAFGPPALGYSDAERVVGLPDVPAECSIAFPACGTAAQAGHAVEADRACPGEIGNTRAQRY